MGVKSFIFEWLLSDIYERLTLVETVQGEEVKRMSELGDTLIQVRDQFLKAKSEILDKIAELEAAQNIDDAKAIAAELKTIAQGYDDIVPDIPA
jgi:hypothetical protein